MRKFWFVLICALYCLSATSQASEAFSVPAKGAVLIDAASGRILFAQNENEMLPMASCTKIMTALIALENSALDENVTAGKNAHGVSGTSIYLSEGETLTMEQMLYGLMLRSGNDAAVAIAEHVDGSISAFADRMNAHAESLNADAHFVNPHGLDAEGHRASALGLARIMRAAMQNKDFRRITATQKKIIPWVGNEYSRVLQNKNRLLTDYNGATGGKTGYTSKAGRCLVFSAERDGMELIGAVLNCYSWFDTATLMLNYGFDNYRIEDAYDKDDVVAKAKVVNGEQDSVRVIAESDLKAAVEIGSSPDVIIETATLQAPVEKGQTVGSAQIELRGQILDQCRLIAADTVNKKTIVSAFKDLFRNWVLLFA